METVYRMKRSNLRWLMQQHPTWTCQQLAEGVEMSLGWVKKWRRRLRESEPDDEQVLHSRSRAPKHPRARSSEEVVARVPALRDEPPEGLRRVPGRHPLWPIICHATRNYSNSRRKATTFPAQLAVSL